MLTSTSGLLRRPLTVAFLPYSAITVVYPHFRPSPQCYRMYPPTSLLASVSLSAHTLAPYLNPGPSETGDEKNSLNRTQTGLREHYPRLISATVPWKVSQVFPHLTVR